MADDGTHMSVKRRSAATTAAARLASMTDSPPSYKSGHGPQFSNEGTNLSFTASPTPQWRGAGDSGCRGGGASPFSGGRSPFSGSSSFAPEPNMFLSNSMTSAASLHPRPRANVAAAAVVSNSGGAHADGGSNGGFTVSGSSVYLSPSLRLLKTKWRRRCSYRRRGLCALLFILFVLFCFMRSRNVNLPISSSLFPAGEDATAEDPDALDGGALEDNLLDISAMGPQEELNGDLSSWSVVVNHIDALSHLNLTSAQRTCLAEEATADCGVAHVHVSRASLPSWTLSTARASSADCAVRKAYATTAAEATLHEPHGVFATSAAPAGRVGPMLFAMSSVTNDVAVRTELPKWSWLRHVHPSLSTRLDGGADAAAEGGSARRSYLAVMGVPSTDQPARVALRTAQRATWMTYEEVARAENNFEGALLPLYLFAAVEPSKEVLPAERQTTAAKAKEEAGGEDDVPDEEDPHTRRTKTATRTTSTTPPATTSPHAGVRLCGHTDLLLPTVRDFQQASQILAGITSVDGFVQRRVVLRGDFKTTEPHMSPCGGVAETHVTASAVSHLPLAHLAHTINLSITPAAVSPAEYVCCASAGLWQETLEHRNVVWIDMMTDRRPTTKKKLGDTTKWGLPVEVGMSQKLILWLLYAHNSFTDVPYIIKGDDDMYLKVPQFLSDFRLLRRGPRNSRLPPPQHRTDAARAALAGGEADAAVDMAATECLYWGSTRRMGGVLFNAGMLFVLQRRLVGVVLECPASPTDTDLLELAAKNYSRSLLSLYKRARFNKEDVLMGYTLHERRARAEEVCPKNRILYGKESFKRFHDLRKGRVSPVSWATVVAHRCRPADVYFLHYYFAHELNFSLADVAPGESREEVAREAAAAWAAETQRALPASVTDWRSLPDVLWHHNVSVGPAYAMAVRDEVPVYDVSYHWWKDDRSHTRAGYKTVI